MIQEDPLTLYEPVIAPEPSTFAKRPAGLGELFDAGETLARQDNVNVREARMERAYSPILDALNERRRREGKAALNNPGHWARPGVGTFASEQYSVFPGLSRDQFFGVTKEEQQRRIFAEIARIRASDPKFLAGIPDTPEKLMAAELARDAAARAKARDTLDRGEGVLGWGAGFVGGVRGALADPVNILSMPIGGGGKTIAGAAAREALVGGIFEALSQPIVARNRADFGEELSVGEAIGNVAMAAVGSAALGGTFKAAEVGATTYGPRVGAAIGEGYDAAIARVFDALPEPIRQRWASAAEIPDSALPGLARELIGPERMTPDELAAINVIERQAEIDGARPWPWSPAADEAHEAALGSAIERVMSEAPPPRRSAAQRFGGETSLARGTVPPPAGTRVTVAPESGAVSGFMARVRGAESSGNDLARPIDPKTGKRLSSAVGRYQFTEGTWLRYYERRFGKTGESRDAILAKRADGELQDVLMRDLTRDNANYLRAAGQAETQGNLYLSHFAGPKGAVALLRAAPDTPVERILTPDAIAANRKVLAGKTAGDVVAWAHRKMGGAAPARVDAPTAATGELAAEAAGLRAEADRLGEELARGGVPRETSREALDEVAPAEAWDAPIDVDFERVALTPKDIVALDRRETAAEIAASIAERAKDRRLSLDPRELARVYEISEDAAKAALAEAVGLSGGQLVVIGGRTKKSTPRIVRRPRQMGPVDAIKFIALRGGLHPSGMSKSAFEKMGGGHDLPGRGLDKFVPGAGKFLRDTGMGVDDMTELLWDAGYFGPPSRTPRPTEAEALEFIEDAFTRKRYAHEDLGWAADREVAAEAKALAKEKAQQIEAATWHIEQLLLGADNPIELDAAELDHAARLFVEQGYSAEDAIVATVNRQIDDALWDGIGDTDDVAYAPDDWYGGDDGRHADPETDAAGGRSARDAGDAGEGRAGAEEYASAGDDAEWRDSADAVDPEALSVWDDPNGPAAKAQADDLTHDALAAVDPNIAARQRQETQLKAASPLQAKTDQDDTIGLGLFDAADQFRLDVDGEARSLKQILDEADAEDAAIAAARACMKPGGGEA